MKKLYCLLLILLVQRTTLIAQVNTADLAKRFHSEVPTLMADNRVPGVAIALLKEGQVVYQEHFGFADLKNKVPVTGHTGFNVGSISKTVTAWGILKLVEQGKIVLDNPANQYLKSWRFPESGYDSERVTIRSLLSHTAGLSVHGYYGWNKQDKVPTLLESLAGKPRKGTRVQLVVAPQTEYRYSGGGYSVLQLIVEEVTGDTFEHYMDTAIVAPMGMNNSSFTIDDRILERSSLEYNKRGRPIPFEHFAEKAAAGFHTTPDDFIKFIQISLDTWHQNQSNVRVISKSSLEEMWTVVPASAESVPNGLGYRKNKTGSWWHGGANAGWWAIIAINPKHEFGLIVLTNSVSGRAIEKYAFKAWNEAISQAEQP